MVVFPFVIHSFSNHHCTRCSVELDRGNLQWHLWMDSVMCVCGSAKSSGWVLGLIQGRGIHRQGHKVQLWSHIAPQEYQQGKPDSAGGRPSPPMVIIYNGEHDSNIWRTGRVEIFKLGVKKSKHQYCLRSDGKCHLLISKQGPLVLWEARLKCCFFLKEGWGLLSNCSMAFLTWILGKVNKTNYKWFWGLGEIFYYWCILADAIGWTFNFLDVVSNCVLYF